MAKQRVILFSALMTVILAALVLLVVFGEIFQCQRTPVVEKPAPPTVGSYVVIRGGSRAILHTAEEEIELPPGSLLEVLAAGDENLEVRLPADDTRGRLTWFSDGRSLVRAADPALIDLPANSDYSALEALMLAEPLGEGWQSDAYPYALASGPEPSAGRHREWEVAYYSPALRRCYKVVLTAGVRPLTMEVSPPEGSGDDHNSWPLGAARNELVGVGVDSSTALQTALANDDRPELELERWRLERIYLVNQGDPESTGEPYRDKPTYRVFLRLAAPMNEDEDREFTDLVIDAADGSFITRLEG